MKAKNLIGKRVKIVSDNNSYTDLLGKQLIITNVVNSVTKNQFYDSSMNGMCLCDLEVAETGESLPYSLYEYEFKLLK